jgi:intracellular sulfur oxidation DsrE/DsrF family protein
MKGQAGTFIYTEWKIMRCDQSYFMTLLIGILLSISAITAHAADEKNYKVILHINNPNKITLLYNSATSLLRELDGDLEIVAVFNGPAVTRLLKHDSSHTQLETLLNKGTKIVACHNALIHNKVDIKLLIPGIEALKSDGNVEIVKYEHMGYHYIKI